MIALVESLAALVQPFADLYGNNKAISTATTMVHLSGLLGGGGLAIATDRAVLRMPLDNARGQRAVLDDLATTHTLVIAALIAIVVSGLLFLAADIKTFAVSKLYWSKMSLVFLLFLNGLRLWRAEGRLRVSLVSLGEAEPMPVHEWQALRGGAISSLVLWFVIMLLGVALTSS